MFNSNYIPVNIGRKCEAVYSDSKVFPVPMLVSAYKLVSERVADNTCYIEDGLVKFRDSQLVFSIEEVYLAYQAYITAARNQFSYFIVQDTEGAPVLFVSKAFKGCRLLVNAFNMHTLLIDNKQLVAKMAYLIDKKVTRLFAVDFFNLCNDLQTGRASYLSAIMVYRDTADAYMAVNPLMTQYSDTIDAYGVETLEEMRDIVENDAEVSGSLRIDGTNIYRDELNYWPPLPVRYVKSLLSTYDMLLNRKSNYTPLLDQNYKTILYFSTNSKYLVNAQTFECIEIKNQHTRDMLNYFATNEVNDLSDLRLAWLVAKQE